MTKIPVDISALESDFFGDHHPAGLRHPLLAGFGGEWGVLVYPNSD